MVLDSVPTKTEAYRVLFEEHGPAVVDAIVHYQQLHGGLSRYLKFQWAYETLLHRPFTKVGESAIDALKKSPILQQNAAESFQCGDLLCTP